MVAGDGMPCFIALAIVVPIPAENPPTKGPNKTAIAEGIITAGLNWMSIGPPVLKAITNIVGTENTAYNTAPIAIKTISKVLSLNFSLKLIFIQLNKKFGIYEVNYASFFKIFKNLQ